MRSFRPALSLVILVLIGSSGVQRAAAEIFEYDGAISGCTSTCDGFAALGGPFVFGSMPSNNLTPSDVTGSTEINVGPNSSFVTADIGVFDFVVFNPAALPEDPIFDGAGLLTNPTTTNPLPLNGAVAALTGFGTTDAFGNLVSGELVFTFTVPPFSSNDAVIYFDLSDGSAEGFLFVNVVQFMAIAGTFIPPGDIGVTGDPVAFGDLFQNDPTGTSTVTVTNNGAGPLTISSIDTGNIAAPLAIDATDCIAGSPLDPDGDSCNIDVTLTTADLGSFAGSFDINTDDPDMGTITVSVSGSVLIPPVPDLVFTPGVLMFPSTVAGNFSEDMVTISNEGDADLDLGTIAAINTVDAPFQIVLDLCSNTSIVPLGSCDLTIQFMPTIGGDFFESFDVPSNDADGPLAYTMEGSAVDSAEPQIQAAPSPLAFGEVLLGGFDTADIVLSNPGTDPLTFTSIGLSGDPEFSQTNDCGATLAVQAVCTVTVVLNGASGGDKMGSLDVISDAVDDPTLTVPITATVFEGPRLTVDPATLDIGNIGAPIELEQTGTGTIAIGNEGASALTVTAISLASTGGMSPAEFAFSEDCTAGVVAVGATCTVDLTFSPVTPGDKMTAVIINSDDPDNPALQVPVTGFVLMGSRLNPSTADLVIGSAGNETEVGQSSDAVLTITSDGSEDLVISAISIGGADAGDFGFVDDCTAGPIARGSSCTITVTFTPTTAGTRSATLEISDNTVSRAIQQIALTGVAAFPPPPPPPPPPASQTTAPPAFATSDAGSGGACFIATAAFGSYLDPSVGVLRDFRDDVLMPNRGGRALVSFYYDNSPVVADFIARHDSARAVTRWLLTPLVYALAYPVPAMLLLFAWWYAIRRRRGQKTAGATI